MNTSRETGNILDPKYDDNGLITAVITDNHDGTVLMIGHMNANALHLTQETGVVHFWSRSRGQLWKKGESSGHILNVEAIMIDCDQDAVWIKARPCGPTCHTGVQSCFYRAVTKDGLVML